MRRPVRTLAVFPLLALVLSACSKSDAGVSPTDAVALAPSLTSLQPANATAGVATSTPIVLHFSKAMMSGMEMLVVLHEGTVTGPVVATTAMWSSDRTTLTMTPQAAMKHATTYVVHMSPSLQDTAGHMINMTPGSAMGGLAVTSGMMGGATSMMNGQWGPGMTGAGWQAANGSFGMMFTFTTA
ncbi:MAG: Ig-like domain-containing domain [Gemmatimonadaceae bacterium]